jgi:hypothetical protein
MFLTGPPGEPAGDGLRIRRAERRIFDGSSELAADPSMRGYLSDMIAPYGLALSDDVLGAASGHSYGEMAAPLVEAIADAPVDLLVVAYAMHDVRFGRHTATFLSDLCPGTPLAFAVCDQGLAAPFGALRAIEAYAATGACRRALLLVVEQSAVHYELARPAPVPRRHAAVALLLDGDGTHEVAVRQHNAVPAEFAELVPAADTVILGAELASRWTGEGAVVAPAGQPCTGVWWELAGRLPDGDAVLAEYDPTFGYLCTATVTARVVAHAREA